GGIQAKFVRAFHHRSSSVPLSFISLTIVSIRKQLFKLGDTTVKVKPVTTRTSSPQHVGWVFLRRYYKSPLLAAITKGTHLYAGRRFSPT
ncbi:hypothetical protein, partial [Candidatus Borrarchaeum sp.]|uniref:hypothetical protein n=1 Tax=Candidatus Borrarchaeum sp. TaxID=2846742 RepID=UPI00257BEDEF